MSAAARVLVDHPVAEAQEVLPSLEGRVAIVTGASSGLGKEAAKWLALRGADEVVLAVRNPAKGQGVVDEIVAEWGEKVPDLASRLTVMKMDLASFASIRSFAAAFAKDHTHLDILVNNAGINCALGTTTEDGYESMWGVNHLGTTLLTHELMPLLLKAPNRAVVATCSSQGAEGLAPAGLVPDTDEGLGQWPAYGRSKAANLVFTAELQRRLTEKGITHVRATGSHPGWTKTDLVSNEAWYIRFINCLMAQPLEMGTTPTLVSVGAGLLPADDPKSGSEHNFFGPPNFGGMRGPARAMPMFRSAESRDPVLGAHIWDLTNKQIGVEKWAFDDDDDNDDGAVADVGGGAGAAAAI